jgi:hypothetical protein
VKVDKASDGRDGRGRLSSRETKRHQLAIERGIGGAETDGRECFPHSFMVFPT